VRYAKLTAVKAIIDIAALHRAAASGTMPPVADWQVAERSALALLPTLHGAGLYALRAAYESTTLFDSRLEVRDEVAAYAVRGHASAPGGTTASKVVEVTRQAIRSWRDLAGLNGHHDTSPAPVEGARELVGGHPNARAANWRASATHFAAPTAS
jgi:hypothetical protein